MRKKFPFNGMQKSKKQIDKNRQKGNDREGERGREGEREHQLFIEGKVKLPWIRQTAGSSPEKRENELE